MDSITDKMAVHHESSPFFTFENGLNTDVRPNGIFVRTNDNPLDPPLRFVRNFVVSEDFEQKTFLDYLDDIYTPPDQIELLPIKRNPLLSYLWIMHRVNNLIKRTFGGLPRIDELKNDEPRRSPRIPTKT